MIKEIFVENFEYSVSKTGVVSVTINYGIDEESSIESIPEQRTFFLTEILNFLKSIESIVDYNSDMITIQEECMGNTHKSQLHYEEVLEAEDFEAFLINKFAIEKNY